MTIPGYSRADTSGAGNREPASIVSIDPVSRTATAMLRSRYTVRVDCSFSVGETTVVPAVGEQWYVERFDMVWRLASRIPFNDATLNVEPAAGQVSVGSTRGPLELHGTTVNVRTLLTLPSYATADRPDPAVGAVIYDLTLQQPVFGDGSVWRDALGTTV